MAETTKTAKTKAPVKATKKAEKAKNAVEVKTLAQLQEELVKLREENRESRRSHLLGELVNPHVLTTQRKAIARTLTLIGQAQKAESAKEEK